MARVRSWESLSPGYRERLSRKGIGKTAYEGGSSLSAARGHAKTPEHPERAAKNPAKYPEYIAKKSLRKPSPITGGQKAPKPPKKRSALQQERDLLDARGRAFRQMIRLAYRSGYAWVNVDTIEANVWGGFTAESGAVPGMNLKEARFTARMNDDDLQTLAAPQYRANPWFYH